MWRQSLHPTSLIDRKQRGECRVWRELLESMKTNALWHELVSCSVCSACAAVECFLALVLRSQKSDIHLLSYPPDGQRIDPDLVTHTHTIQSQTHTQTLFRLTPPNNLESFATLVELSTQTGIFYFSRRGIWEKWPSDDIHTRRIWVVKLDV